MAESMFLVLNFGSVCRLCLTARGRLLTDIFHPEDENVDEWPLLHQQIALLTGIQVSPTDMLPQRICYKCRHLVDLCYELRDTAERTNRLLTEATSNSDQLPSQTDVKREIVDSEETGTFTQDTFNTLIDDNFPDPGATEQPLEEDPPVETECDNLAANVNHNCIITAPVRSNVAQISSVSMAQPKGVGSAPTPPSSTLTQTVSETSPKKHFKLKHPKKLTCEICLTPFQTKEKMCLHVRQHYQGSELTPYVDLKRPFRCERCDQEVQKKAQLVHHHLRHLNMNPFFCRQPGCSYIGKSKDALRQHGYSHSGRSYVCETCGSTFRRNFDLQQHIIRHADEGTRFPCRRCGVVCANRITYRIHVRSHERARSYKCERVGCPKAFYNRAELRTHTRSHDNERSYRCHLCVSSYISQSQLNRHLRMHQVRKLNKCDKCCATFDNYAAYCNHRIRTHGAWQPHKCIGCNQGYQSEARLEKHTLRCKLAINVKNLLSAEDGDSLGLPSPQQDAESGQGLLCGEESMEMDTLDSLLLRNLKTAPVVVTPGNVDSVKTSSGEITVLPQGGLLYIEVDDEGLNMERSPSPSPQHTLQQ